MLMSRQNRNQLVLTEPPRSQVEDLLGLAFLHDESFTVWGTSDVYRCAINFQCIDGWIVHAGFHLFARVIERLGNFGRKVRGVLQPKKVQRVISKVEVRIEIFQFVGDDCPGNVLCGRKPDAQPPPAYEPKKLAPSSEAVGT